MTVLPARAVAQAAPIQGLGLLQGRNKHDLSVAEKSEWRCAAGWVSRTMRLVSRFRELLQSCYDLK